ncbi:alanine racemase [Caenispirillum salinarum]|uniref:alanine racemase n=1 Tax=Caenispirillum salinarum TaxID=859058 RepID=UPI003851458B
MVRPADLPTPSLLLDLPVLCANLAAMNGRMAAAGVALRPHLKTAKCPEVAMLATEGQAGGITVSTVAEARGFAGHGFKDILYAVGAVPGKIEGLAPLVEKGAKITLITDNVPMAEAVSARAAELGVTFDMLVEIDVGGHRAGVLPDGADLLPVARAIHTGPGTRLAGVMAHAGQSYHCRGTFEIRSVAWAEREGLVHAAERLRDAGLPCPVVSGGSTPTAMLGEDFSGLTEMRPGVYMFMDVHQLMLGVCKAGDLALSVLASVIGHNRHSGHLLLDAGALALSKDVSATELKPEVAYGVVCDLSGRPLPNLFVTDMAQEHGLCAVHDDDIWGRLPVGAKVRIMPNHACMTAACFDAYHVLDKGEVVDKWKRFGGW